MESSTCSSCGGEVKGKRGIVECSTCKQPIHKECAINDNGTLFCDTCFTVKEEDGIKQPVEFEVPKTIRRSHIETYRSCPYKFYMEVIKGYNAPPTIYNKMGSDLHELFEKASKDKSYRINDMVNEFNTLWQKYPIELFDDEKQYDDMYLRATNCIKGIYNILPSLPPPFKTEENIKVNIGDGLPSISTTLDRIDEDGDGLIIRDWKTGKVMVGEKISSDLQAPLYIYAAREEYKRPIKQFIFHYLPDKERVFNRIDDDNYVCTVKKREYFISINDAIRETKSIFSHILKGEFNVPLNTKSMYFTCKMCHLPSLNICKGAYMQSWSQYNK